MTFRVLACSRVVNGLDFGHLLAYSVLAVERRCRYGVTATKLYAGPLVALFGRRTVEKTAW